MKTNSVFVVILLIVLSGCVSLIKSANILAVFPIPSKSHDILGSALLKHLANIGHNVTYISAFSHKNYENFHSIHLEKMSELKERMQKNMQGTITAKDYVAQIYGIADVARMILEDDDVQNLIHSDSKFDVLIHFMGLDSTMVLAHHFNIPIIVFSPIGALVNHNTITGNPSPPSYVTLFPSVIPMDDDNLTFIQRVVNTVAPYLIFNVLQMAFNYMGNQAIQDHFPGYPPIQDIIKDRVDLILVNSDISSETPRPYVPNMIQIGGFHLQKPKPLTEDLKKVLDDAKEGFVYLSFGTNVKLTDLPNGSLEVIKKCLGKLPFKIIIKYDEDDMVDKPKNFYVRKWFPQPSVLAHPNIKLFISHGGFGGMTESLYYGVPVVCVPFFADQTKNCADAQRNGHSVTVDILSMNEKSLSESLEKVLYNERFKEAIKFKSELYRNQPMNPMDKAVYWIEHVIKHKGAKHLKVKGLQLSWYQYYSLDVFLFLAVVIFTTLSIVYYSCLYTCKFICICCKRKTVKKKDVIKKKK